MNDPVSADDGCRLWTQGTGDGQPLVMCHGGPGLWDMFEPLTPPLAEMARVVRWDQRGCGRSQRRGPYTLARFIADLDTVREQLGGPAVSLLGHSWGATLALLYTLRHPDRVTKLIYVSGTGIDTGSSWKPAHAHNLRRALGTRRARWEELVSRARTSDEDREYAVLKWSADFADPATADQHAEAIATPWLDINWQCATALNGEINAYLEDNDLAAACRALTVPTLIIDGALDIRPRTAVDSLHQCLPRVQRTTLNAGHLPWVEDPDGFREAVAAFLTPPEDPPVARELAGSRG
jgi:proline iminopeptidase